jgi:hypothetical protein
MILPLQEIKYDVARTARGVAWCCWMIIQVFKGNGKSVNGPTGAEAVTATIALLFSGSA